MNKNIVLPLVLIILFILLACSIGYEGAVLTNDEELNKQQEEALLFTSIAPSTENEAPLDSAVTAEPEPTSPPATPVVSETEAVVTFSEGATEYSVTAQNFDCICTETGNVTQQFKIEGDILTLGDQTYNKIGNDTYRRSWMGYYILVSGEGDNKTETQVEEERSSVIILTSDGYIMENYQGDSGSPCCINTFTENK